MALNASDSDSSSIDNRKSAIDNPRERALWQAIESVTDPEIPVLSVVDMGIIAGVRMTDRHVTVDVTPTFVGCPAIDMIRDNIKHALAAIGENEVDVNIVFDPPWTSDRMTKAGRRKLKEIGFSPPVRGLVQLGGAAPPIPCPHCSSNQTVMESMFGPTLCRAIYYCRSCRQSFEHFKTV
jgi:ring-1,2-phenylacetyl-CoA epoxidase subunit PaaD